MTRKAIPQATRKEVMHEAGHRCASPTCQESRAIDVHHIVAVEDEGSNEAENLLALCPTCHALFHRKAIPVESVQKWKARLVAINAVPNLKLSVFADDSGARQGFALATQEFWWRTCLIGVMQGNTMMPTGLCCFVDDKLAVTVANVVDTAIALGGKLSVFTRRGVADFAEVQRLGMGGAVLIKMGALPPHFISEIDPELLFAFAEPLQTPVKLRMVPFVGEPVAFITAPINSREIRGTGEFQVETAMVSLCIRQSGAKMLPDYFLTPVAATLDYFGNPVFTETGRLVGLVSGIGTFEGELAARPVVTNIIGLQNSFPGNG